ncbi:MAG: HAMP domain-containing protein [Alphaproteobacteria bacterium]|nr:HAMP domain-containing protein [Alphaproteobacteria bacterium]
MSDTVIGQETKTSKKASKFSFNNFGIGVRIMLVLTLPLVATVWLGANAILDANHAAVEEEKLGKLSRLGQKISATVHEMQKERGMSAVFINTQGKGFKSELPGQRATTDTAAKAMFDAFDKLNPSAFGTGFVATYSTAKDAMAQLTTMRGNVSSLQITVPQMAGYYTPTIAKLLSNVEYMTRLSHNSEISNSIATYTAFLQAKERAGVERAMGAAGFSSGKFAPKVYQKFVGLIAAQNDLLGIFRKHASKEQFAFYNQTMTGAPVDGTNSLRKIAIDSPVKGNVGGVTGPQWFKTITSKIDLMKRVEDRIANDLVALTDRLHAEAASLFRTELISIGALLVATLLLVFFVVRGITGPLAKLTGATTRLAEGDTTSEIDIPETTDEVGTLVGSIKVFQRNLIESERLQAEQQEAEKQALVDEQKREEEKRAAEAMAEEQKREADAKADSERKEAMLEMADEFEKNVMSVVEGLSSATTEMQSSAEAMSATAEQTTQQASTVAASSGDAANSVQTVAAAAEELSASVGEISRQVKESNQIAQSAVQEAQKTNEKVQGLAEAAQKIGDVVSLINDIASQTNLLALNATIEAARAGDAGKGFAVVASEVKSLATQTGKATEEIGSQIAAIQSETEAAVEAIQSIGATVGQMGEIATSVASAVEEQGSATREIASSVQHAATGTQEVSSTIGEVTQAATENQSSAGQMLDAAKELAQQGTVLRDEVGKFLESVRAA